MAIASYTSLPLGYTVSHKHMSTRTSTPAELPLRISLPSWTTSTHNWNCLVQFREIPWNQTADVHDNGGDNVTLALYNVTLASQKLCWHDTGVIAAKQMVISDIYVFQ